jgi:hypothetical protein
MVMKNQNQNLEMAVMEEKASRHRSHNKKYF